MSPYIPQIRGMGEKYRLALRAETKDREELLWELIEYRYNLQKMVDELWDLTDVSGKSQLHAMFYDRLTEEKGYRAHVARNMYKKAGKVVVKSRIKSGA